MGYKKSASPFDAKEKGTKRNPNALGWVVLMVALSVLMLGAWFSPRSSTATATAEQGTPAPVAQNAIEVATVAGFEADAEIERINAERIETQAELEAADDLGDIVNSHMQFDIELERQRLANDEKRIQNETFQAQERLRMTQESNAVEIAMMQAENEALATRTALLAEEARIEAQALAEQERIKASALQAARRSLALDIGAVFLLLLIFCGLILAVYATWQRMQVRYPVAQKLPPPTHSPIRSERDAVRVVQGFAPIVDNSVEISEIPINNSEISDNSGNLEANTAGNNSEISQEPVNNSEIIPKSENNSAEISEIIAIQAQYFTPAEREALPILAGTHIPEWAKKAAVKMDRERVRRLDIAKIITGNSGGNRYKEIKQILDAAKTAEVPA